VVLQVVVPDGSKDSSSLLSKNDMSWHEQLPQEVQQAHQKMEEILGKIQQADQRTQSFVQQLEEHVKAAQQSIQQSDQHIQQLEEVLQTSRQQLQQVEEYQQTIQQIDQRAHIIQQQSHVEKQNFIDRTLEICGLFGLMYAWYVMYDIASYPLGIVYGVVSIVYLVC
jgi:DNA primase